MRSETSLYAIRIGSICLLRHINRQQKILKRPFYHSKRGLMPLEWLSKEHGALHFTGSATVAKQNTRVTRRVMHGWEHFSAVKEKLLWPNGGSPEPERVQRAL